MQIPCLERFDDIHFGQNIRAFKIKIILSTFHVLIIFYIYQTRDLFPKNSGFYPLNFANICSITVKIRQLQVCVNVVLDNSAHSILIIGRINRSLLCI